MRLFEWHRKTFEHKHKLPDFINYLSVVWQNRNRYEKILDEITEEEEQEQKIHKQRFFDFTIDGNISARNYVGVVQFEDIRVEVYPKIFSDDETVNTKKWQLNLLYWLSYCRKIKFPFSIAHIDQINCYDFLELLIYIFANYTEETLSLQPYQNYYTIEEETTFLKGQLLFPSYIKNNLTTGKWQHFYCRHKPFIYDNLFNQIIKYVTRRLYNISKNPLNKEKLNEILFLLYDVSDISCTASDCDKIKLNPLFSNHQNILELCKLYLSNQVIDMNSDDNSNFCFLVPMEYIFEDFIYGFLSNKWPYLNLKSQSTDFLALTQNQKVFQIKNDIYIKDKLIIDTKYKIRHDNIDLKSGVCQTDMYQVTSYALRRNCNNVILLYPETKSSIKAPTSFQIFSEMIQKSINIEIKTLDITIDNFQDADNTIANRVKTINSLFA